MAVKHKKYSQRVFNVGDLVKVRLRHTIEEEDVGCPTWNKQTSFTGRTDVGEVMLVVDESHNFVLNDTQIEDYSNVFCTVLRKTGQVTVVDKGDIELVSRAGPGGDRRQDQR